MAIYAKIMGTKQGEIKGSVTARAFAGQVPITSCEFGIGAPFDLASGQPTGRRVLRPVQLVKPLDISSPLLIMSLTMNEPLTVDISYVVEGEGHQKYVTLKLSNAMIRDFDHLASADGSAIETISLSYTRYEFTWVDGGLVAMDDLTDLTTSGRI